MLKLNPKTKAPWCGGQWWNQLYRHKYTNPSRLSTKKLSSSRKIPRRPANRIGLNGKLRAKEGDLRKAI